MQGRLNSATHSSQAGRGECRALSATASPDLCGGQAGAQLARGGRCRHLCYLSKFAESLPARMGIYQDWGCVCVNANTENIPPSEHAMNLSFCLQKLGTVSGSRADWPKHSPRPGVPPSASSQDSSDSSWLPRHPPAGLRASLSQVPQLLHLCKQGGAGGSIVPGAAGRLQRRGREENFAK